MKPGEPVCPGLIPAAGTAPLPGLGNRAHALAPRGAPLWPQTTPALFGGAVASLTPLRALSIFQAQFPLLDNMNSKHYGQIEGEPESVES
jgi:hypothetical protein